MGENTQNLSRRKFMIMSSVAIASPVFLDAALDLPWPYQPFCILSNKLYFGLAY
jgi:hypothetical protein